MDDAVQKAADLLKNSRKIAVLTGAGVSKESGVPTFRDALDGLWARFNPQELATPMAFANNPKLVWEWYEFRREMMQNAKPNPGHIALAALEKRCDDFTLITQNVDDLHEQAGSENIIHLHGSIAQNKCFYDCQGDPTLVDISQIIWDKSSGPPPCPHCGRWVRPNVVWFHEMLPAIALAQAYAASRSAAVMLVVGTSGLVTPAADLPSHTKSAGGKIIEVNPDYSMITRIADIKLDSAAGEVLPQLLVAMEKA